MPQPCFRDVFHEGNSPGGFKKFRETGRAVGWNVLQEGQAVNFQHGQCTIVVGAVPWSQPDLAALDEMASRLTTYLTTRPSSLSSYQIQVWLFNLDEVMPHEQILPGVPMPRETPIFAHYSSEHLLGFVQGRAAILLMQALPFP